MYGATATPFLQWAESCGIGARADGFGMLVEQAAEPSPCGVAFARVRKAFGVA